VRARLVAVMERPLLILETAPDERLVALASAGDERAFAAIVARYRTPLRRYCRRFLSAEAADDAVQQTFINAHAALTSGRPPFALKAWLYRIAHNAALNLARAPQTDPMPDELLELDAFEDVIDRREAFGRVLGAVRALPASQRQVIVRHAFNGETHEDIAADLGVAPGAVRQLAFRARGTLRAAA
jgi:RNA polymerase sigma factor (sigma-70 family)